MAVRKSNIYSKVNFQTLEKELRDTIGYLESEKVDETLEDDIDWKQNQKGGVSPSIVSTIEKKIETQMNTIDTCSKILKVLFEKQGLSEFIKYGIETLTSKLEEIETYYSERPISSINKRHKSMVFGNGKLVTFLACSREDGINSRTKVLEKIFKVKPIITELESMKEEVLLKGGSELPESMMYD